AKTIAVLSQFGEQYFTFTVKEIVNLGRYPHQKGLLKSMTSADHVAVEWAMKQTDVAKFAEQSIHASRGGEQQRVYLEQALDQEPELLLHDEPTNHVDIIHQKIFLDRLKKWVHEQQLLVIAIFHDLNVVSLYCNRILLMDGGKGVALCRTEEVL